MQEILAEILRLRERMKKLDKDKYNDDYEFEKSIAIINCLLDRAENTVKGNMPEVRWSWVEQGYTPPDKMVEQAEVILVNLIEGVLPFKDRFAEVGGIVIDHALIKKDGLHHLIYIRGKACTSWSESPTDNFGHAVSRNLKNWVVKQPVMQACQGTWEDYQVWAPHIIHYNDEYWMFYTGVNYNVAQAIGVAKSKDLYNWERCERNPVIKPGDWGYRNENDWSDCRDPMVLQDGDRFFIYYTASLKDKVKGKLVYCIGIASSYNLLDWNDEGYAILDESSETPPESPFVLKKDGKYFMFYTDYKAGTVFAASDDPVKGWSDAPKDKRVVKAAVSASEVYEESGKWYLTYISHDDNQLSFFEVVQLIWNEDGSFTTAAINEE